MLQGKFVFISVESRESNGKVYNNVNLEMDDGQLLRVGVDDICLNKLQKYKEYNGFFKVGTFNREIYLRLEDVQIPAVAGK